MSDHIKRLSQVEPSNESSEDVCVVSAPPVGDQVQTGGTASSEVPMDLILVEPVDQDKHDLLEVENNKLLWRLKVNELKLDNVELEIKGLKDKLVNAWRYVTWERASQDTMDVD
ncbi:hypothetical protein L1987_57502 [Smallanthus sonchifolius]|uniref:Uncharacterized protein n=1 Tax=Smallanthus sonchifolius TaxID=185202 RepID=A0ACB9DD02_9ASTR|nr:hypothetical protein L1987_57502 [Smallanthus sonchifolius]